jgi:hypothetical protein
MERKARTNPAQLSGLGNKKKSGRRRGIFLDFPFYRTYQELRLLCPLAHRIILILRRVRDWNPFRQRRNI